MATSAPPAPDPVVAAFETSKNEFYRQLKDQSLRDEIQNTTSIDDIYNATRRLQEEQGKRSSLRNLRRIDTYLQRLNEYAGVLETFVQAKPDILALIWGPIKLLIHLSSNLVKSFDAILDAMCMIGEKLPVFKGYAELFAANQRVNHVLALIFRDVLEFHLAALNFFALKGFRVAFEALWPTRRGEIDIVAQNIEKHSRLMVEEVTLAHISKAHDEWMAAHRHYDEQREEANQQYFNAIERYVEPRFYDSRLDRLHMSICAGTGTWLTEDETFNWWLDPAESSADVVWLQGFPGAGKTYISSRVVDYARGKGHTLFAFLRYDEKASARSILHSFIFQLSAIDTDLRAVLCNQSRSTTRDLKRDLKSSTKFATDMLLKLVNCATGPTYIVVDGLDELDEDVRREALEQLLYLRANAGADSPVKLFISSRPEENIDRLLKGISKSIRLDQKNHGCIQKYVAQESQAWLTRGDFDPATCSEIKSLLAFLPVDVEGMFLYARIVMRTIQKLPPQIELIRKELRVPPKSLHEAYQRVLQRIDDMPDCATTLSKRILAYVACSPVPITVREMEQFLLLEPGNLEPDKLYSEFPRVRAPMNVLQHCGPLVDVVEDELQFVHFTVKEYLCAPEVTAGFINPSRALVDLTETCVWYLSTELFNEDLPADAVKENLISGFYRLCNFASSQWYNLTHLCARDSKAEALPDRLISALEDFILQRENLSYKEAAVLPEQLELTRFRKVSTKIHDFLCQTAHFTKRQRDAGDWSLSESDTWVNNDPTTVWSSLADIRQVFEQLLDSESGNGTAHGPALQFHYGPRLYKCDYILCPLHRLGFVTKAACDAHTRQHGRPFKCTNPDCDYAIMGFSTEKQRDDHCHSRHRVSDDTIPLREIPSDDDEFMPLVAHLVSTNSLEKVEPLLWRIERKSYEFIVELRRRVAFTGSLAMFQLLTVPRREVGPGVVEAAIRGANYPVLKELITRRGGVRACSGPILASESADAFDMWASHAFIEELPHYVTGKIDPAQAQRITAFWPNHPSFNDLGLKGLNESLRAVAQGSCSMILAKFLVEAGADVNFRVASSPQSMTPLHCATKKTSPEAAELAKYLLICGADPSIGAKKTSGRNKGQYMEPAMERGAQNIQKWLGMSWDELVRWAKEERARCRESTPSNDGPSGGDSL